MKLNERFTSPTPKFYRKLRNFGLGLAAAGGAILASPIALPTAIVALGGYLIVAGTVASAVAQSVTADRWNVEFKSLDKMKKVCSLNDWKLKLRAKRKPRFKPGSELSEKVNIMNVEINEENDDLQESKSIHMKLEKESKEQLAISYKERTTPRFKAGADLTEKVNVMEIELMDEVNEDSEISEIKLISRAKENVHRSIEVRRKSKPRFKPGTDLTDKVNMVEVEVIEEMEDDFDVCEITINISSNACAIVETAAELN
jgi:nucleoid DNA-binding protein